MLIDGHNISVGVTDEFMAGADFGSMLIDGHLATGGVFATGGVGADFGSMLIDGHWGSASCPSISFGADFGSMLIDGHCVAVYSILVSARGCRLRQHADRRTPWSPSPSPARPSGADFGSMLIDGHPFRSPASRRGGVVPTSAAC